MTACDVIELPSNRPESDDIRKDHSSQEPQIGGTGEYLHSGKKKLASCMSFRASTSFQFRPSPLAFERILETAPTLTRRLRWICRTLISACKRRRKISRNCRIDNLLFGIPPPEQKGSRLAVRKINAEVGFWNVNTDSGKSKNCSRSDKNRCSRCTSICT